MSFGVPSSDDRSAPDLAAIVSALDDDGCREIVTVLEEPLTAQELSGRIDRPLSTTYRKLDRLTEAGLVTETVGVRSGSHHKSRYVADFERVSIGFGDDGDFDVDLERSKDCSVGIWSEIQREF
ncbi:transcriptional regulator [Halobiforma lacisalsi AJ5]|uniref:Transcriptional regulator n=1 Tax=Natronobacterium lacisalsi AJ5 TaxID=358396 RepID=M0LCA6_NATLA|nr:helix-turn-helix domain-containing protein [Halobiforma lacisalsi]APW99085.1 transcriptional regulator [Halobiforma lacisalsi AJ5]EMA31202.1 hypothetical protein C445_14884 [Halobiforma lacisalsi AJ5]